MLEFSLILSIIAIILLPIGLYLKEREFRAREMELEMELRQRDVQLKKSGS